MNRKAILLAIAILASGRFIATAQEKTAPSAFTAAQAEAGRKAYENSCGKCHAYNLLGRKRDEGEATVRVPARVISKIHNQCTSRPAAGRQGFSQPLGRQNCRASHPAFSGHGRRQVLSV